MCGSRIGSKGLLERTREVREKDLTVGATMQCAANQPVAQDHREGRHTFLIFWEGFNFLRVHGPPTEDGVLLLLMV